MFYILEYVLYSSSNGLNYKCFLSVYVYLGGIENNLIICLLKLYEISILFCKFMYSKI